MTTQATPIRALHDAFLELEERAGLWDLTAFGRRYWHNVRWDVWGATQRDLGLSGPKQGSWRSRPWTTWLEPRLSQAALTLRRSLWHDIGPADLLVINHPRHVFDGGDWRCAYSDPLLRDLDRSRWVIEQGYQGRHYAPNHTRGVKYIEWAKWRAYAAFALRDGWRGGFLRAAEVREIRAWAALIRRELGGGPTDKEAVGRVRAALRRIVALGGLFERLLDRVRPKAVIHVVHYNFRSLVLTPLARARSIPVIELQHGFIGPTHLAYNVAPGRRPDAFPDYLLLFGDLWREITPGLPLAPERTPAIGFARLEALRAARGAPRPSRGPRRVLFVSQPAIGEALSAVAVALAARLDPTRYHLVYKLHPAEMADWRARYPALAGARLEVADSPRDDIYDRFAEADVQVGVYSTALFEGLAFGLPTVIVALPGHEDMEVLVERGLACRVESADALADLLAGELAPPPEAALEKIWQPGARERFRRFLDDLLR